MKTLNKKNSTRIITLNKAKLMNRVSLIFTIAMAVCFLTAMPVAAASSGSTDPLTAINNMSNFVFAAIKAIGSILLGFGIVQIGLALKSHDAGQRAQGFLTFFGGIVIYFAKDILDMIL